MRTFPGGLATKAACSSEPSRTGFTLDDHTVDDHDGTPPCPAGHTAGDEPVQNGHLRPTMRRLPVARPMHHRGRSITIHEHDGLLRAPRAQAHTPEFKAAYPTRAGIEPAVAHVATQNRRT